MSIENVNLFNLLENTQIGVVIHNVKGIVEYANPAALDMLEIDLESIKGSAPSSHSWDFIDRQNRQLAMEELPVYKVISTGEPVNEQIIGKSSQRTGKMKWFSVNAYPERKPMTPAPSEFVVVYFTNISEKVNSFSHKDIVENAQDMILVTEAANIEPPLSPKIIYANNALCAHTEYTLSELIGETPRIFQGALTDKSATKRIKQALIETRPCSETLLNYTKTGTPFWVQMNIFPLKNSFGEVTHFAAVQRNISELKFRTEQLDKRNEELKRIKSDLELLVDNRTRELRSANLKLERLAFFDALTNIPNRRAFFEGVEKLIHFAIRNNKGLLFGLADVDHFKSINDNHGHAFGDDVLVYIAETLKKFFRVEDVIGRVGGEEFAFCILLPDPLNPLPIIDRLREKISSLHKDVPALKNRQVTLSIGAVYVPQVVSTDIKKLFTKADEALYDAKNKGRNCVVCKSLVSHVNPDAINK